MILHDFAPASVHHSLPHDWQLPKQDLIDVLREANQSIPEDRETLSFMALAQPRSSAAVIKVYIVNSPYVFSKKIQLT